MLAYVACFRPQNIEFHSIWQKKHPNSCICAEFVVPLRGKNKRMNRMLQQNLIERKQYMQQLRDLRDQNVIKVISGVRRCGNKCFAIAIL